MPGEHWIAIYVDDDGHYGEYFDSLGRAATRQFEHYMNEHCREWIIVNSCRVLRVDSADIIVLPFVLLEVEVLVWLILYAILIETLN